MSYVKFLDLKKRKKYVRGGHLTNCVPSKCELHIDIRFPSNISSKLILEEIRKSFLDLKHIFENQVKYELQIKENISSLIDGFEIKEDNLLIGALRWAIYKTIKEKPKLIKKTSTTFINNIGMTYNIPSITYSQEDPKLEHTNNEFIDLNEFSKCIEVYEKFFIKFFEIYNKKYRK